MTMYNETYGTPWTSNQPPHRWFSPDCYPGINMAERYQREDISLWPSVQTGSPATDAHSPMSSAVATDLFKWKSSNHGPITPDFSNITSDAMNNNLHHPVRHESTSSTGSYRSNGASGVNSPTTPNNNNNGSGASLVIPQPVKPAQNKSSNKTYQCKMCDQIFSTKSDMLIHSQQIHKQDMKPYRCPQCQKCFANSSYLSQHNRIHAGIKPYKCEICERKFTQLSHLQQHIRTHTGEKPYKCHHPGCGKAFSQLSNLQSHSRSHMTDKPYRCNSCYKCYADEAGLREHIPKHSETKHIKTQICKICGKAYTQETYLARHMLKHTNENAKMPQKTPVKQEPSEHSNLDVAMDFTRILDRVDRAQDSSTPCPSLKSPGSSVSSAFMPLSQFGTTSSNSNPYHYGSSLNTGLTSGLSTNNLNSSLPHISGSSLPHISSMSTPRYLPYDPMGFRKSAEPVDRLMNDRLVNDRLVNDRLVNERLERNINLPITTRPENMLANSFLSLQHIKNYASQQMPPSFSPCPSGASRLT